VPAEIEPPELAALVAYAERSRVGDWSLRSALCRYAQPQPVRVSEVLELVRRIEFSLHKQSSRLVKEGPAVWAAFEAGSLDGDLLLGLLDAMRELDRLGDVLADWALDRAGKQPEAAVDETTAEVAHRLDAIGVPHEERVPPPGARQRG
jgi:hypothetical protein